MVELFTTEELQAQLKALYEMRRNGTLKLVKDFGAEGGGFKKEFTYRSEAELLAAIRDLERRLGVEQPGPNIVVRSSKGW